MDSLTQLALGTCVSSACVAKKDKRVAAITGAVLGTLPDLDIIIRYADPVDNFVKHRGFSHSIFFLFLLSLVLWIVAKQFSPRVKNSPIRWFLAIMLTLLTHTILDAHTVYGTQLFWPMDTPPVMWSTLFIIDPFYSVPLLLGVIIVLCAPHWKHIQTSLNLALVVSTVYLGWSWVGKTIVDNKLQSQLESEGHRDIKYFSVPTPFNTLLWRVVVMEPDGYREGFYSLLKPEETIEFEDIANEPKAVAIAPEFISYEKLHWFSHGFLKTEILENELIVSDLRMGVEPEYVFRFIIAENYEQNWQAVVPQRIGIRYDWNRLKEIYQKL